MEHYNITFIINVAGDKCAQYETLKITHSSIPATTATDAIETVASELLVECAWCTIENIEHAKILVQRVGTSCIREFSVCKKEVKVTFLAHEIIPPDPNKE